MSTFGYKGSVKSGVTVTVYPSLGNGSYGSAVALTGNHTNSAYPAIVSVHVQSALAQGTTFSVSLKKAAYRDLIEAFPVDSWVDISFTKNGLSWHTVRGLIDEVRMSASVSGSGATVENFSIIGRSFQKIYEDMPANFDAFLGDVEVDKQVLYALNSFVGSPDVVCKAILVDILKSLGRRNRGLWAMPTNMPGVGSLNSGTYNKKIGPQALFVDVARFVKTGFDLYALPRAIPAQNLLTGGGALWGLAQQYSDSTMCELFTELLPKSSTFQASGVLDTDGTVGLKESDSAMVTILRDRPYMAVDPKIGFGPLRTQSPYFKIPQFKLSKQILTGLDVGRSSYERLNAFWLGNPDPASKAGNFPTYKQPIWDVQDQIAHGLRKMVVPLNYNFFHDVKSGVPPKKYRTIDECTEAVKRLVRDWYCPNALFLSGSIELARGAPWVKVGCRLRIEDDRGIDEPLNGYIESVSHTYSLASGVKTSISFTRGFYGEEREMVAKVAELSARYVVPNLFTGAPAQ